LLKHIAGTEPLSIWSEHTESSLKMLAPLVCLFYVTTLMSLVYINLRPKMVPKT